MPRVWGAQEVTYNLRDKATESALQALIEAARTVAYVDDAQHVGMDDFFRKMQLLSIELSSLKQAVKRYDDTLAFFEKGGEQ